MQKKMGRESLCRKHHVPPLGTSAEPRSRSLPHWRPRTPQGHGGSGGCTVTCGTLNAPGATKPGSGCHRGRDWHGGREQAEALTIENKDFIIFFQFTGQFPFQTINRQRPHSQQHPGLIPCSAAKEMLWAPGVLLLPTSASTDIPPRAVGGNKY